MKSEAWTLLGCCMGTVRPSRRPSGQPPGRAPQDEVNLWWHKEKFLMLRRRPWAFLARRSEAPRLPIQPHPPLNAAPTKRPPNGFFRPRKAPPPPHPPTPANLFQITKRDRG